MGSKVPSTNLASFVQTNVFGLMLSIKFQQLSINTSFNIVEGEKTNLVSKSFQSYWKSFSIVFV